ncbi:aminotransferase class V-fold PLP-dependent enzyme [uncultured Croceitalea sp.]|uniref:aminotransferase class V-fold PLP-dependent enzyme n=1 Tax=uncultured Croceitalea sp. TaxID=1798908 RepID=UPI003305F795
MDIEQIRKDITDYGEKVFLDSAGSSLMPKSVVRTINRYLLEEEKFGGYAVAESRAKEIADFYSQVALLIGAKPKNIAFTHDATDAYTKALLSISFNNNDVIITTDDDYASNQIQFISLQKRFGIKIFRIKTLENGELDITDFQKLVDDHNPKLLAVTHVPTNSGLIQNVEAIGEICHNQQITFLLDACQSIGQLDVNVNKIKCDFLSATGRKFLRGPRGTGFLYVSDRLLKKGYSPLMVDGGGAIWKRKDHFELLKTAKRFQTWEAPYALLLGLREAARYANKIGLKNIQAYNQKLMLQLRENLNGIQGVKLYDKGLNNCNILTFRKDHKSLKEITEKLTQNNVFYTISKKEWGVIDFEKKGIDWAIRLSPHYFNTKEEVHTISKIIDGI